jgi:NTE family protein
MANDDFQTAVVLSGGGARAAYQIGALRGVAKVLGRAAALPFKIVTGTSAGAINAATMAVHADRWRCGVARLLRLWRNIEVGDVYEADLADVSVHGMRWLASVLVGGRGPARAASMLDNAPLRSMLEHTLDLSQIERHVRAGLLHALAINATSYTTGHAVTFFDGAAAIEPWKRTRRRGQRERIGVDHLLASTAIPFIFPAALIGEDYYADGSMRQIAPMSPALHLGARRILVIAVGQFSGGQTAASRHPQPPAYPSFAQIAGHALSSIFLDNLGADFERMQRLNHAWNLVPGDVQRSHPEISHIDALLLAPSRDLGRMALPYAERLPTGVRYLLRGLGGNEASGANLLSYLMFDRGYCRELLRLGFADALARREEIAAFLAGDQPQYLPLFPADLLF